MEISSQFKPQLIITSPGGSAGVGGRTQSGGRSTAAGESVALPLERMQQALRSMPEVDLAKVEQIRQALQRGEISLDPAQLAASILAYHRGSGV